MWRNRLTNAHRWVGRKRDKNTNHDRKYSNNSIIKILCFSSSWHWIRHKVNPNCKAFFHIVNLNLADTKIQILEIQLFVSQYGFLLWSQYVSPCENCCNPEICTFLLSGISEIVPKCRNILNKILCRWFRYHNPGRSGFRAEIGENLNWLGTGNSVNIFAKLAKYFCEHPQEVDPQHVSILECRSEDPGKRLKFGY